MTSLTLKNVLLLGANATGTGGWQDAFARAQAFLAELSLEEKVEMVTGTTGPCAGNIKPIERLNFNGLCLQDGPAGIRQAIYASVFPAGVVAAASWDRSLMYHRSLLMGREFRGKGAHVALMPVAGPLGRHAQGGRNWEGFSPDPYLTGVGMEESVRGMQAAGVQATSKHYIGNEQEIQRNPSSNSSNQTIEALSSNIDDRTMHELYLWPFANAVHAGTASIMCSYQRLNTSYGCQNSKSLNGILKEELGFQGYVMSDWGAVHAGVATANAGLDMNMPGGIGFLDPTPSFWGANLTTAVNNGSVAESRVDDMVLRIMTPYFYLGQDEDFPFVDESSSVINFFDPATWTYNYTLGPVVDVRDGHAQLIRDLASAGTVLLKNTNNALPLRAPRYLGVFGNDATEPEDGLYSLNLLAGIDAGNYEDGTLAIGGGSGTGRFTYIVPPLEAIKRRSSQDGTLLQYVLNNDKLAQNPYFWNLAPTPPEVCIFFAKTWCTEGADRPNLDLEWNATALIANLASICNNTIVVTHSCGINDLAPIAANPNVTAILAAHYPGQETGNSIVNILYGDVNPSGHLPYTIGRNVSDGVIPLVNSTELLNTTDPNAWQADFTEGQLIDYRHFDARNITPLYHFGYGLSYTTFNVSDLSVTNVDAAGSVPRLPPALPVQPGGNPTLWSTLLRATVTVANTGEVAGAVVPQLYVSLPQAEAGPGTPVKTLRGFDKVYLEPGESAEVGFDLLRRDLSFWDVGAQQWRLPTGAVQVAVGLHAGDLSESTSVTV
ncbi:hypothetical protein H2199_008656 [Coniosporium tulheliwenetii]|uniref:Uncharacterized protein n=1 Tax=Coniosporium tulheliwenetii TaxID=3383036 RepID=A0ACC2YIJ3_9PEZI|nr:hypothetical protein H2199_008656 [Cladosporium sp. JES 115]